MLEALDKDQVEYSRQGRPTLGQCNNLETLYKQIFCKAARIPECEVFFFINQGKAVMLNTLYIMDYRMIQIHIYY